MKPATPEAYQLMHEGALALADMEANGFKVNIDYVNRQIEKVGNQIEKREEKLKGYDLWKTWTKMYGRNAGLTKRKQLVKVLMQEGLLKDVKISDKGNVVGDRDALERVDHPFIGELIEVDKLRKLQGTYLEGIRREVDPNGLLHCFFNLHLVTSYRGSSDSPNLQNIPIRDPGIAKIIRRAFVPRADDRVLVEIDYSGVEVKISAVYNEDPALLAYLAGEGDMHRDAAADLYMCEPDQVSKTIRGMVKNQYVFPEFYGSYYKQCAPALWESIDRYGFEVDGTPMKEWLKAKGIRKRGDCIPDERSVPGTFEHHVAQCERVLWNDRFHVYRDWKKLWYAKYVRRGYFRYKTGFVVDSIVNRKEACNWPVQGTAFHCLLWSLIQINKQIKKKKMDALLVSNIHDSIVADVHKDQVHDYVALAMKIMTKRIMKHWSWLTVQLDAEAEVAPVGKSWFHKKEFSL